MCYDMNGRSDGNGPWMISRWIFFLYFSNRSEQSIDLNWNTYPDAIRNIYLVAFRLNFE